jgi:WhiB family redox-sensing transcriptional regulator
MTDLRHLIPFSADLFSLIDKIQEVGEIPCRQFPDLFYPDSPSDRQNREDTYYAKQLCKECPVIDECLMYALKSNEPYGIWGGWTPDERRKFLTSSRKNPLPSQRHP